MLTIKEVADYAGVAISTVSKVLNNYPNISEDTKEKVRKAIDELHYVPNTIAAALSLSHTSNEHKVKFFAASRALILSNKYCAKFSAVGLSTKSFKN